MKRRILTISISIVTLLIFIVYGCKKDEQNQGGDDTTIPELNEYTLNDNVIVIDSTIEPIVDGNKYTFNFTSTYPEIEVGDIIVGQSMGGFIKEVVTIETASKSINASLILILKDVLFQTVFKNCNFDLDIPITVNIPLNEATLYNNQIQGTELEIRLGQANYQTDLIMNFRLVRVNGQTQLFSLIANGNVNANIESVISSNGEVHFSHEENVVPYMPFPFMIGPVPALFDYGLNVGFDLNINSDVQYNYTSHAIGEVEFGAEFSNNDWEITWEKDFDYSDNFVDWNRDQETSTEIYVKPDIKFLICGVVGPALNIKPFLALNTDIDQQSWSWDLKGGVSGNLAMELSAFGFIEVGVRNLPLAKWEKPIASDQGENLPNETFTDPRDGQEYDIVTIGDQTWFAENLNYETTNSWWYDNSSASGDVYGRLYTWDNALIACPEGWHLPSDEEWKILEGFADTQYGVGNPVWDEWGYRGFDAGKRLKATTGWPGNYNGNDFFGFAALGGGYRHHLSGNFVYRGQFGVFWTSTEYDNESAITRSIEDIPDNIWRTDVPKTLASSIRCIKD
jgi:uncharacterized protein (TIGR02145 family)